MTLVSPTVASENSYPPIAIVPDVSSETFGTNASFEVPYFNLFLILDVGMSLMFGRTGNTLKYFNILLDRLPEVAERGVEYPAGNYLPQIVAKAGLVLVLGVLPFYYWYTF